MSLWVTKLESGLESMDASIMRAASQPLPRFDKRLSC